MSRIIVLVGSVRKGGNTDLLAQAFAESAGKHHEVELLSVADYDVHPCVGCNSCYTRVIIIPSPKAEKQHLFGREKIICFRVQKNS